MEKTLNPFDSLLLYGGMTKPSVLARMVDDIGFGFVGGTVAGSFFHFIKLSKHQPLLSRMKFACTKSPRVGGFCALFSAVHNVIYNSVNPTNDIGSEMRASFIADPVSAALMWAPKGIRSAAQAALLFTTVSFAVGCANTWFECLDTSRSMQKTNTYSYPYYRPRQY